MAKQNVSNGLRIRTASGVDVGLGELDTVQSVEGPSSKLSFSESELHRG